MKDNIPSIGPEPVLISRKEVDALYDTLGVVTRALSKLDCDYIVTGGTLLGAIRQHSILFCDDDIDIAIIDHDGKTYDRISAQLQGILNECTDVVQTTGKKRQAPQYKYTIKPWEAGDKVRPLKASNVFLDIFVLRKYVDLDDLLSVIGVKKNGQPQSEEYIQGILSKIQSSAFAQKEFDGMFPLWHFSTRKAIELWPKEVYRPMELFPLSRDLKLGPLIGIHGPRMPVLLLKRAFGFDCFNVYYQSGAHQVKSKNNAHQDEHQVNNNPSLKPIVQDGGAWEGGKKMTLEEEHYLPMQPIARARRRPTMHGREQLMIYLDAQIKREDHWRYSDSNERSEGSIFHENGDKERKAKSIRPRCTVYMDGVFDLFHIGHLRAIQECIKLGDKVIIGVTGHEDATGYKREPIIAEAERVAIISALKGVDYIVCPCPLIVTEEFMEKHDIDLVVHGFANDADAERQKVFFDHPMRCGKFKRIPYYKDLSTTDILCKIRSINEDEDEV